MPPRTPALVRREVPLPKLSTGVVVRPRFAGGLRSAGMGSGAGAAASATAPPQILVFLGDEIRELLPSGSSSGEATAAATGGGYELSTRRLAVTGHELRKARHPVLEPTSGGVFFVEGYTIKRLDGANAVSLVAGSETENGRVDGARRAARFNAIHSLAADGKGRLFVAEALAIRVLDVGTGEVTTLPGSAPPEAYWTAVTFDTSCDVLVAATPVAVCHVTVPPAPPGGGADGACGACGAAVTPPRLVAGSWSDHGNADGDGGAARFWAIWSMLAAADGVIHIGDCSRLRRLEFAGGGATAAAVGGGAASVTTSLTGAVEGYTLRQMAILPGGELAVDDFFKQVLVIVSGGAAAASTAPAAGGAGSYFKPASEALAGRVAVTAGGNTTATARTSFSSDDTQALVSPSPAAPPPTPTPAVGLLDFLLASPRGSAGGGGEGGAVAAAVARTVMITTRGGRGFVAHGSVLAARSDYFRCLLEATAESSGAGGGGGEENSGGGGKEASGDVEVLLPEADPDAFGRLLVYMYTGELVVPDEQLKAAAALAQRLRLPADVGTALQNRLLAAVTPGSVVSELAWAERHGMTELAARLLSRVLATRREVAAAGSEARGGVAALATAHPELTAELMLQLLAT